MQEPKRNERLSTRIMSSLPKISPRERITTSSSSPRKELVEEYALKHKAYEAKLAAERQALLDDAAAAAAAEKQRKLDFKRDIVAQMEEKNQLRQSQRQEDRSPSKGGILHTAGDDAQNKALARIKARQALLESERLTYEQKHQKDLEVDRLRQEEAQLHAKIQEERKEELIKERQKKLELAQQIEKQKKMAEAQQRSKSQDRAARLAEERKIADELARLAEQQRREDEERARYEKRIIAMANADVARHSGRQHDDEKSVERQMRSELEEAERQRRKQEAQDKLEAKLAFKRQLEEEALRRTQFSRTHDSELATKSPRRPAPDTNALKAADEVNALKLEQLKRQQEYKKALEQQIQEHEKRKRETLAV